METVHRLHEQVAGHRLTLARIARMSRGSTSRGFESDPGKAWAEARWLRSVPLMGELHGVAHDQLGCFIRIAMPPPFCKGSVT